MQWTDRKVRLANQHRWFAWHPVRIGAKHVWLESLARRLRDTPRGKWYWEYEEIGRAEQPKRPGLIEAQWSYCTPATAYARGFIMGCLFAFIVIMLFVGHFV